MLPEPQKQAVYDLLNERNIPFEAIEHPPVHTMEDMEREGITGKGTVCKNLFMRNFKGNVHYLLTLPYEKPVDLKALAAQIGSTRLSFGSAERLMKYLHLTQGCVSPLGLLNDESRSVIMIFDRCLQGDPQVGVHPNDNTAFLWMPFDRLQELIQEHGNGIIFADF